jgi:hypothetical protein
MPRCYSSAGILKAMPLGEGANPFPAIKRKHSCCVPVFLARIAFTSSTLRMFDKGAGKKLRDFLVSGVGCGHKFARGGRENFERQHLKVIRAFPQAIHTRGKKPRFGQKAKILDLYLKVLSSEREPLRVALAGRLRSRLHVPLDNIVLKWVWQHFGAELKHSRIRRCDLVLSKLSEENYRTIQKLLRRKASKAGAYPILYDDLWAWDEEERTRLF